MPKIYPEQFEAKIGFDRIREMLEKNCISPMGIEWTGKMHFQDRYEVISVELAEVTEFTRIIREMDHFPASHFYDLRPALEKIKTEGRYMEAREMFDLKRSLEAVRAVVRFFGNQDETAFPLLKRKTSRVQIFPYIYDRINSIIDTWGKIRDNASPELARLRKDILSLQSGMSRKLHAILKQAQKDGLVDEDASVSIRDGRAVIPVLSSNKRKIGGIVYDTSASGKTSYIEPNEIVEMNNEIREMEYAERREIIRILMLFADDIRPYHDELFYSCEFLGEIDFIRAKGLFALKFDAISPELTDSQVIQWKKAVHPLLRESLNREKRKIVPLDIHLDSHNRLLLISGPNAGGKSVCLKTVGLLQYMLQCGMLIPVGDGSKAGIFSQLFIDIGDEQSLENDLSTYSSHLLNMKFFLKNCHEKTLILIDEFGSGTEPMLGGAIAESILDELCYLGTFGVVTTHYTNLKHFASAREGIVNGAMLYDSRHMNPLFILDIGKPGSSFAFEIARKIGLPETILEKATEKIGKKHIDFDRNLRKINRDKRYWESKRQKIRQVEKKLDVMARDYEAGLEETQNQRREILKKAREEAEELLSRVNKRVENTILEIKKAQAEKEKTRQAREKLKALKDEVDRKPEGEDPRIASKMEKLRRKEEQRNRHRPADSKKDIPEKTIQEERSRELTPGDKVRITGQDSVGELIELSGKNAVVAFGQLITTLPRKRVERISRKEAKNRERWRESGNSRFSDQFSERRLHFKPETDVRGQRAEEALIKIRELIDEAIMFGANELRILHGKGHGILKETIRNYLRSEPMVKNLRDEHVDLGGAGITVVTLAL